VVPTKPPVGIDPVTAPRRFVPGIDLIDLARSRGVNIMDMPVKDLGERPRSYAIHRQTGEGTWTCPAVIYLFDPNDRENAFPSEVAFQRFDEMARKDAIAAEQRCNMVRSMPHNWTLRRNRDGEMVRKPDVNHYTSYLGPGPTQGFLQAHYHVWQEIDLVTREIIYHRVTDVNDPRQIPDLSVYPEGEEHAPERIWLCENTWMFPGGCLAQQNELEKDKENKDAQGKTDDTCYLEQEETMKDRKSNETSSDGPENVATNDNEKRKHQKEGVRENERKPAVDPSPTRSAHAAADESDVPAFQKPLQHHPSLPPRPPTQPLAFLPPRPAAKQGPNISRMVAKRVTEEPIPKH